MDEKSCVGAKLARDAGAAVVQANRVIVHREQALLPHIDPLATRFNLPLNLHRHRQLRIAQRMALGIEEAQLHLQPLEHLGVMPLLMLDERLATG